MSGLMILRIVFALILAGALAWGTDMRQEREADWEIQPKKSRYVPFLSTTLLPTFLTICIPMFWIAFGWRWMVENLLAFCFTILLQLSVYTALLMALLPLLRRRLRPSACAILWMLPNYLYLSMNAALRAEMPQIVLPLPGLWFVILGGIWLTGFGTVMVWGIVTHLRFRHEVLRQSAPVTEPEILELLEQERDHAGQRKLRYRLLRSPAVKTPLTIGMFSRSTRIVLPERLYTMEELRLVLRHEMVHIGRGDSLTKFYLLFCTAMGWWNPLMWLARRRSADDLELSCDETVLRSMDSDCRRPYAELLLRTAGDQRGFTTCLSASAGALRYRLGQVMEPGKRARGVLAMAAAFTLLMTTIGSVTVGYLPGKGREILFNGAPVENFVVEEAYTWQYGSNGMNRCIKDEAALWQYLSETEVYHISSLLYSYDIGQQNRTLIIHCQGMDTMWVIELYEDYVLCLPWSQLTQRRYYYCPGILEGMIQRGIVEVDEDFTQV